MSTDNNCTMASNVSVYYDMNSDYTDTNANITANEAIESQQEFLNEISYEKNRGARYSSLKNKHTHRKRNEFTVKFLSKALKKRAATELHTSAKPVRIKYNNAVKRCKHLHLLK